MRVLVAPQAFKGSLDALGVAKAIEIGLNNVWPDSIVDILPVADGGEGTVEALVAATGGQFRDTLVEDPLGRQVNAQWGVLGDGTTAVIEMAAASGLPLLARSERDPLVTSTFGTGQLIKAALDEGVGRIVIGIGGSATNDGGAGMAHALGVRLLDTQGRFLPRGGRALQRLGRIDMSRTDERIMSTEFVVASDVTNPLCGPNGASAVYGPQKGASARDVAVLDRGLARLAEVMQRDLGMDVADAPGSGAAGGLGAGLLAFTGATIRRGVELIFEAIHFDDHLEGTDIVFTGEGRVDAQDAFGKAPIVVAQRAKDRDVPVIIVVGSIGEGFECVFDHGVSAVVSIMSRPMTIERAVSMTGDLISGASEQAARLIAIGMRQGRIMPVAAGTPLDS